MKRSKLWLTAALPAVLLLATAVHATLLLAAHESAVPTLPPLRRSEHVPLGTSRARPLYNASVVPGGVYTADELRAAIAHDPVVADHYRAAAVKALRPVTLTVGRAAYVSYRVNDDIYWTRRRVWIRAGETVLTDGTTMVRARCGNCISDRREGPVAAVDPAHGELDGFVAPPRLAGSADGLASEGTPALGDLLEIPFGPQVFAAATPEWRTIEGDTGGPYGRVFPMGRGPGIIVPASWSPGAPPAGVVPADGGTTTGAPPVTDGSPFGGTTSTTGFLDCCSTASPPDTTSATTVSPSPDPVDVPESDVLWLVACGVIGLASRRWRRS